MAAVRGRGAGRHAGGFFLPRPKQSRDVRAAKGARPCPRETLTRHADLCPQTRPPRLPQVQDGLADPSLLGSRGRPESPSRGGVTDGLAVSLLAEG